MNLMNGNTLRHCNLPKKYQAIFRLVGNRPPVIQTRIYNIWEWSTISQSQYPQSRWIRRDTMEKLKRILQPRVFIIGIILIANVIGSISLARYIYQKENAGLVRAEWFYFTSNLLGEESEYKYYSFAPDTKELDFTLGNHADGLRYSEVGITYEVTVEKGTYDETNKAFSGVTDDDIAVSYKQDNDEYSQKLASGKIYDNKVTLSNLEAGTYKITAKGYTGDNKSEGYYKTLTAIIQIEGEAKLYKYLDTSNSQYVLLTVWAQGCKGDVTITFPDDLIPDNTDSVMEEVKIGGKKFTDNTTFKDNGYSSHTYRFFINGDKTSSSFADSNFEVSAVDNKVSVTAEKKTPE
jgi:hypothetical protein